MSKNLLVSSDPMPNKIQEEIYEKKIKECVGKLEINNSIKATCFFLKLPIFKNNHTMKVLLTNNHVINIDYLEDKKAKPLKVEINGKQKIIDFCGDSIPPCGKKRFYYTNEKYDFTIIEIKEYDFIDKFLEVDEQIFSQTYEQKYIYIMQYPQKNQYDSSKFKEFISSEYKGKLSNDWGIIIKNDEENIIHNCKTYEGSSGSPIILAENHKVIGLHKGEYEIPNKNDKNNVKNLAKCGTSLKKIIEITKENNKNIVEEKEYKEYFYIFLKSIIYNIKRVLQILLLIMVLIISKYFFTKKKLYHPNGNLSYYGYMLFNKKHWKGISYYENNKTEYDGQWKNGLKDGHGILYMNDENNTIVYNGTFEKDLISGKGIEYYENGNIMYNGSWLQNKFHGLGQYYYPNNQLEYNGLFSNGRRDGDGILYNEDGSYAFWGDWKQDNRYYGELFYDKNNRTEYIGYFNKDNRFQWKGRYYYNNEENTIYYDGYFENGRPNYNGTFYYENGNKIYEGSIIYGYFHGKGISYYDNGQLMYNGTFELNKFSGNGILYFKNSTKRIVGEFKNGKCEGKGILYANEEIIYNGTFKDNNYKNGILYLNINGTKAKIFFLNFGDDIKILKHEKRKKKKKLGFISKIIKTFKNF